MTIQWKDELESKFGLTFDIIDRERISDLRGLRGFSVNPWSTGSRFIISHSLLTEEHYVAGLRDVLGEFRSRALLVVDDTRYRANSRGPSLVAASAKSGANQWQCQTNANQTAKCAKRIASGCQLTPLGQRGEAVLLEDVASAEVAIVVEVIVDRGVDGGEFLQGLDVPEFRHCPFP